MNSEIGKRLFYGLVLFCIFFSTLYHYYFLFVVLTVLSWQTNREIFSLALKRPKHLYSVVTVATLSVMQMVIFIYGWQTSMELLLGQMLLLSFILFVTLRGKDAVYNTTFIIVNYVFFAIFVLLYAYLAKEHLMKLFVGIVGIVLADSGAYLTGKMFGKRKLCPSISPNKTVFGFVGGYLISVGFLLASNYYLQDSLLSLITILSITIVSQIGDLYFSWMKRQYQIKDFSTLLPGHGGLVDRLDSISFGIIFMAIIEVFLPSLLRL